MPPRKSKPSKRQMRGGDSLPVKEWKVLDPSAKMYQTQPQTGTKRDQDTKVCTYPGEENSEKKMRYIHKVGTCVVGSLPATRQVGISYGQKMMAVSTEWVTNNLFKDIAFMNEYIQKFNSLFNDLVIAYLESNNIFEGVYLIYKGGNVIVDYICNLVKHETDLSSLVSRSDIDFQVFVADNDIYEAHSDQIIRLVVEAAYKLREWLMEHMEMIDFEDAELSDAYPQEYMATRVHRNDIFILQKESPVLEKVLENVIHLANFADCQSLVIKTDGLLEGYVDNPDSFLYISYNDSLRFKMKGMNTEFDSEFDLVRIKYNIDLVNQSNLMCVHHAPGEILDVSFSTPNDFKMTLAREHSIGDWTQMNKQGIRIPTLNYLVNHDLTGILFEEYANPWNDGKYEKRLKRLISGLALLDIDYHESWGGFLPNGLLNSWATNSDLTIDIGWIKSVKETLCKHINDFLIWILDKDNRSSYLPGSEYMHGESYNPDKSQFVFLAKRIQKISKTPSSMDQYDQFLNTCLKVTIQVQNAVTNFLHNLEMDISSGNKMNLQNNNPMFNNINNINNINNPQSGGSNKPQHQTKKSQIHKPAEKSRKTQICVSCVCRE
jgi:hypothetical protein